MVDERVFAYMEKFLKENDYPLIHTMSCEQIADIYHISNRCFLVCWFLKLLKYDSLEEFIFDHENDKVTLANLVCGYGFCSEKEKLGFMNGDLPAEDQLKTIYTMCKFISHARRAPNPEDVNHFTLEKLTDLVHQNLNLFPKYGEMKTLTDEEKQIKIAEWQVEIENSENLTDSKEDNHLKLSIDRPKLKEHINDIVDESDKMLNEFHKAVIGVNRGKDWSKIGYKINPEASEKIATCLEHIKTISQHIVDLKAITQFSADSQLSSENNEYVGMINELVKQTRRRPHS